MIDHMTKPVNGRHPDFKHLVMAEADHHHSMFLITFAEHDGNLLVSWEEWVDMVGDQTQAELQFAYVSDEHLDLLPSK